MLFWVMTGVFETIDYRWLHFVDNLVSGLTPTSEPHACSDDYMDWFIRISHPFISPPTEDEASRSPTDRDPHPPSDQEKSPVSYFSYQCYRIHFK